MPKSVRFPKHLDNGRFLVEDKDKLGEGCFGAVFLGTDTRTKNKVAVKFEDSNCGAPGSLVMEAQLLKKLAEPTLPQGFVEVFFFGKLGSFTCLVMDRLGKCLEDCMEDCRGKMEAKTVVLIAQQALQRLEYLHSRGVVHRDIKPENFMWGVDSKIHHLYIIDFGLSEAYWSRRHICMTTKNSMVGTARYASISTHKGINQTRRDDLEALAHMLIYFLRGALPWSGLKGAKTEQEKYRMIGDRKESTPVASLCADMHGCFAFLLTYARSLPFAERPDYEKLSHVFTTAREELQVSSDHDLQWLSDMEAEDAGLCPLEKWTPVPQPDDKVLMEEERRSSRCFPFLSAWRNKAIIDDDSPMEVKDSE